MKVITLLAVLILVILTTSCKKIRDDLLPQSSSKLYCQAILNPDSAIRVYVGKTTGILNMEPSFINDATVLLYENNIFIDTLSHETNGKYFSSIKPSIGEQYTIKVIEEDILTAATIVPDATKLIDPEIEFPTGYDAVNQEYYGNLTFTIDDNPSIENFYEVVIFYKSFYAPGNEYYYSYLNNPNYSIVVPDPVVKNEGDWDYFPTTVFFSDKLFNGKKQAFSFSTVTTKRYLSDGSSNSNALKDDGYILLRSISKEYYLYRKYYTRHAFNSQIHDDGIQNMLFTGEPLDMYTNVTGGLGVVAGFSSTMSKIKGHK